MRTLFLVAVALISLSSITAQQDVRLKTDYGSDNKELQELMRFQGIEKIRLRFEGAHLKGKHYAFVIKEFTNGRLAQVDTLAASAKDAYIQPVQSNTFKVDVMVQTRLDHTVKFYARFDRFSVHKIYDIEKPEDAYALHDFLGPKDSYEVPLETATYVLGYFLPYVDKDTGWKKYCEVSGSKYAPEDWGKAFDIPNYFLVEVQFY
jgi:hypothetical protein